MSKLSHAMRKSPQPGPNRLQLEVNSTGYESCGFSTSVVGFLEKLIPPLGKMLGEATTGAGLGSGHLEGFRDLGGHARDENVE